MPLPTPSDIWWARVSRRLGERDESDTPRQFRDEALRKLLSEWIEAIGEYSCRLSLQGPWGARRWGENPVWRDEEHLEGETNRIWTAIGEHLGVGPPPETIAAWTPDRLREALDGP